jgi:hypothetical protein
MSGLKKRLLFFLYLHRQLHYYKLYRLLAFHRIIAVLRKIIIFNDDRIFFPGSYCIFLFPRSKNFFHSCEWVGAGETLHPQYFFLVYQKICLPGKNFPSVDSVYQKKFLPGKNFPSVDSVPVWALFSDC